MDALIPPISSITELELPIGIWTPWAQILCAECHGDEGLSGRKLDMRQFEKQPLDPNGWHEIAICDDCGKSIWMDFKIAWEQKIVRALKEKGHDTAAMSQTGGMCSAADLVLGSDEDGGQKNVWITESEDTERPRHDPTFFVGYYHIENPYGDDVEGEYSDALTFDEAITLVEKTVKEGRFNA